MGKTAFMFPGQGAQYVGMGKDFYEQIPVCKEMFELAGKASGLDVVSLCFEENEQINITEYTQIAMLAAEVAMLKAVEEKGIKPDVTAGLSLGEYGALAASGVMTPAQKLSYLILLFFGKLFRKTQFACADRYGKISAGKGKICGYNRYFCFDGVF